MIILGIETSCDETALSIVKAEGGLKKPGFKLLGSELFSQIDLHKEFGGVYPNLARRAHSENLIPLLKKLINNYQEKKIQSGLKNIPQSTRDEIKKILIKESGLFEQFEKEVFNLDIPKVDAISVTYGPGLEPALWVGVSFAKALSELWGIPVIPTNHMEGHIISPIIDKTEINFPSLALLISGGHTELVKVSSWGQYEIIGKTRDDAVGEAFDKVARILGLPYPGGPEISKLAHEARQKKYPQKYTLPRPMITSPDFDFSFSGIKTAVLYTVRDNPPETHEEKCDLAREFENAVTEVLIAKTKKYIESNKTESLIIGGGVVANNHIRSEFKKLADEYYTGLYIPDKNLATDNAIMIAMAGYIAYLHDHHILKKEFIASGNLIL